MDSRFSVTNVDHFGMSHFGRPLSTVLLAFTMVLGREIAEVSQIAMAQTAKSSREMTAPATVEEAEKVLDLRDFPLIDDAGDPSIRSLGTLMYGTAATIPKAFEFQKKELESRGFVELPGGYVSEMNIVTGFKKDGFLVRVSASESGFSDNPLHTCSVTLVNDGNVALDGIPVPPGVKTFDNSLHEMAYTTDAKPEDMTLACRELVLADGWEPYGSSDVSRSQPGASMEHFKKNAIKLQVWVMTTPVDGGKTLLRYSTELMSADLPAWPKARDPRYSDTQKMLTFEDAAKSIPEILAFYQDRLPQQGWKATTDHPVVDDRQKTQFLVFRNERMDLLSLDLRSYKDSVNVKLVHQTKAEVDDETERANAAIAAKREKEAEKLALKMKKIKVAIPLPAKASKPEIDDDQLFEFRLPSGSGPATLAEYREHFTKLDWVEEKGASSDKNIGSVTFKKDKLSLSFSYFDTGITPATITVKGRSLESTLVLVPEPAAMGNATPAPQNPKTPTNPKTPAKPKKAKPPGFPDLPPGVELPDDARKALEEAMQNVEELAPAVPAKEAPKKPATKKPAVKKAPEAPTKPKAP